MAAKANIKGDMHEYVIAKAGVSQDQKIDGVDFAYQ